MDSSAMESTGMLSGLQARCSPVKQKPSKRVSFKEEAFVIYIPAHEESVLDLRKSILLTRNAIAESSTAKRMGSRNGRTGLRTVNMSSYANQGRQTSQQTTHLRKNVSELNTTSPRKSILKTPQRQRRESWPSERTGATHNDFPRRDLYGVSTKPSTNNYFKQDTSRLLLSAGPESRQKTSPLGRVNLTGRSTTSASRFEDDLQVTKTGRLQSKGSSPSLYTKGRSFNHRGRYGRYSDHDQRTRASSYLNIVGVPYNSIDCLSFYSDINGTVQRLLDLDYQPTLEHSMVSKDNKVDLRGNGRLSSAFPSVEAFQRRNSRTNNNFPVEDTSRPLPIAWQPAKQYNFSTK